MKSSPFNSNSVRWGAATLGLLGVALTFNAVRNANAQGPKGVLEVCDPPPVTVVNVKPNGTSSQHGISLDAALSQAKLQRGSDGELYLHCGVTVSEDAGLEAPRRPLNLALVLDTSGSMQGSMGLLREATLGAIKRLGPQDKLTIVAYSSSARLIYSGIPAQTGMDAMTNLVNGLHPGGNTNLSAGIELAAQHLAMAQPRRATAPLGCDEEAGGCVEPQQIAPGGCVEPQQIAPGGCKREPLRCAPVEPAATNYVQRMLVLTDGLANLGVTDPQGLRTLITRVRSNGNSVSSLGLGAEFNEELLGNLADSGGGAYHYVSEPQALDAVYAAEVEAMQGLVAKRAELVLTAQDGTVLGQVFSWPSDSNVDSRTVSIGDLSRGRSLKVVARLNVGTTPTKDVLDTLTVTLRYQDPDSGAVRTLDPVALSVGLTGSAEEAQASVDEAIAPELVKVQVARQLDKAREAAKAGRYEEAQQLARECKEIAGEDSMSYDAPAGAPCEVDFDELADGLAEGEASERGRRAMKQSHAAGQGASR